MEVLHEAPGGGSGSADRDGKGEGCGRPRSFHFERHRLNRLLAQAAKCPLVAVCAGAGYGKTSAVRDFVRGCGAPVIWVQLSELDGEKARFWENYVGVLAKINPPLAKALESLGFPDTVDRMNRYLSMSETLIPLKRRIVVVDDFHFIEDPAVLRFVERTSRHLPVGTTMFLLSRRDPGVAAADMVSSGRVFSVGEDDLRFSEGEVSDYFGALGIDLDPGEVRDLMQDSEGWAFALNLAARSYGRAPGYAGYVGSAVRANVLRMMETEVWAPMDGDVRLLLLQLSLIGHLSVELVRILADGDDALLEGLERQSAYVRRDDQIGAFLIHPLFMEFLSERQGLLPENMRRETLARAADWCAVRGFRVDALTYRERLGDYAAIVSMLYSMPVLIPGDVSHLAARMLDRAPAEAFVTVPFLAALHVRSHMCLGRLDEAAALAARYEARLLALPESDPVRGPTLSRLYFTWSFLRGLMCAKCDVYDFDLYMAKHLACLPRDPVAAAGTGATGFPIYSPGAWINSTGSARRGSVDEYLAAFGRMTVLLGDAGGFPLEAENALVRGELAFFRGDMRGAEEETSRALGLARRRGLFGLEHMALFYLLRVAVARGSFEKAQGILAETEALLSEESYADRFAARDISQGWYLCAVGLPEEMPAWLRKDFSPYAHAGFMENFGNQIKARHSLATGDLPALLAYAAEMRERESFLLGRVEILALEACARYRMGEKGAALAVFEEAFRAAEPNGLVMPFVELGKDMRTLSAFAMREEAHGIPRDWLEAVNRRAASHAKRRLHVARLHREANRMDPAVLSARESEVLSDLAQGLSRTEIAAVRGLSVNTVKMIVGKVHSKLGTGSLADLVRVAVERGMV